jgi:hypothetical protein
VESGLPPGVTWPFRKSTPSPQAKHASPAGIFVNREGKHGVSPSSFIALASKHGDPASHHVISVA